jgi:hypothetical protein
VHEYSRLEKAWRYISSVKVKVIGTLTIPVEFDGVMKNIVSREERVAGLDRLEISREVAGASPWSDGYQRLA